MNTKKFERIAVCGGTHGNELTGVSLVRKWRADPSPLRRESFEAEPFLSNPRAVEENRRYMDQDLNRCFLRKELADPTLSGYEQNRAKVINRRFGPKGNAAYDLLIDLHTTTANMGSTVIIQREDGFARKIASYLSEVAPEVKILAYTGAEDYPFLAEVTENSIEIEVGPVPQGVIRADALQRTEEITSRILDYVDAYNRGKASDRERTFQVYTFGPNLDYLRREDGTIWSAVHPLRQDRDFEKVEPGDPMFLTFDGETVPFEGAEPVWPIFVNEAAYYEKRCAMTLCRIEKITA
ncbi:MAG: aspartoacylase [Alkalispirochaetaceae bacterium]